MLVVLTQMHHVNIHASIHSSENGVKICGQTIPVQAELTNDMLKRFYCGYVGNLLLSIECYVDAFPPHLMRRRTFPRSQKARPTCGISASDWSSLEVLVLSGSTVGIPWNQEQSQAGEVKAQNFRKTYVNFRCLANRVWICLGIRVQFVSLQPPIAIRRRNSGQRYRNRPARGCDQHSSFHNVPSVG